MLTQTLLNKEQLYLLYPSSWGPTLNPYADLAKKATSDWLRARGAVNTHTIRLMEDMRPDLYGGYPYPSANFEHLTTLTEFLTLWMLFDDLAVEGSDKYWREHGLSLEDYTIALRGGPLSVRADPFLMAWGELGQRFAKQMSPAWCARLSVLFTDWLGATRREHETYSALRREARLPDPELYLSIRMISVGVLPTFYFIEYAEGFELPAEVSEHPALSKLRALGTKLELLSNDLASLEKDLRNNWPNMVTVLKEAENLSLREAVIRVVEMHNDTLQDFLKTEAQMPSFGAERDPFVSAYIKKMHYIVRGFAEFQLGAERYRWKEDFGSLSVSIASLLEPAVVS
jgi:hypothetical protein